MGLPATLTALTLLDYFGTMVFSCGGSIIAGENDMDLMGSLLLGTCSGIGGGTLRDVLLGTQTRAPGRHCQLTTPLQRAHRPAYIHVASPSTPLPASPTW
jgi:hypothetical protein